MQRSKPDGVTASATAMGSTMSATPRRFYEKLALGAPAPLRELPVRLERMIHFVPPHVEKVRARAPELATEPA